MDPFPCHMLDVRRELYNIRYKTIRGLMFV